MMKIMRSIAMSLLTIDPLLFLIDMGFGISDFGFKVFCVVNDLHRLTPSSVGGR
jgi:hypothetical protein